MDETDEDALFESLESDTRTVALRAALSEWMTDSLHRVSSLTVVCGWWRTQMREVGYSDTAIEEILPMIIQRVWPDSTDTPEKDEDGSD